MGSKPISQRLCQSFLFTKSADCKWPSKVLIGNGGQFQKAMKPLVSVDLGYCCSTMKSNPSKQEYLLYLTKRFGFFFFTLLVEEEVKS